MALTPSKGLYTLKPVKVQHLVELLSEVVELAKSVPLALANKGFRANGVTVQKGQPIRIISRDEALWQGNINNPSNPM